MPRQPLTDAAAAKSNALVDELDWAGSVFLISAASGVGCDLLCQAIMNYLEGSD